MVGHQMEDDHRGRPEHGGHRFVELLGGDKEVSNGEDEEGAEHGRGRCPRG